MNVTLMEYTSKPIDLLSSAAGVSYGKCNTSENRLQTCIRNGHESVLEHATVTFNISGVSRACSHQLVRHRMASFVEKSQRYTKVDDDDWYMMPPSITGDGVLFYKNAMDHAKKAYDLLINECGVKPEDARLVIPQACCTDLVMTMNYRELFHFFDLRISPRAQWEIRMVAKEMYYACMNCADEQVRDMMTYYVEYHRNED